MFLRTFLTSFLGLCGLSALPSRDFFIFCCPARKKTAGGRIHHRFKGDPPQGDGPAEGARLCTYGQGMLMGPPRVSDEGSLGTGASPQTEKAPALTTVNHRIYKTQSGKVTERNQQAHVPPGLPCLESPTAPRRGHRGR